MIYNVHSFYGLNRYKRVLAISQALTTEELEVTPRAQAFVARPRLAIIGGGFSGAAFAILLLRNPDLPPCDLILVEPRAILGAGVANSAEDLLHRVNIASDRMAVLPDELEGFDIWIKAAGRLEADPAAFYPDRGIFPARALFGLYVDELLRKAAAAAPHVAFRHVQTRVEAATRGGDIFRLECASGESIDADILLLATGHPAPRLPWPLSELPRHEGLIVNPWRPNAVASVKSSDHVLIVGSGLTMGDMIASLRRQGRQAPLTAISRRGLTPRVRAATVDLISGASFADSGPASQVLRAVRREIRKAEAAGRSWSDVFDAARQQNGAIWAAWNWPERRRFQRHLRPFWDVHRFQAAPQIHDLVTRELSAGSLTIFAAAMTKAEIRDEQIDVSLRRRGQGGVETRTFDAILNCTGATGPLIEESSFLLSLAKAGLIARDAFGSGIDVDALGRPRSPSTNTPDGSLYVLGPAVRGCLGEISGALEIAIHAQGVAKVVAAHLQERGAIGA